MADGRDDTAKAREAAESLVCLPARALVEAIGRREFGVREVVTAFLDRIDRLNPVHNAIVSLRPRGEILTEADRADALPADHPARRGALFGLPIAIKDLALTNGLVTTFGSPLYRDHVPAVDSIVVERIRAAGAILVGKTNTPEFGLGSQTYNTVFGHTRNAFDPAKTAGGSSGGAAVALALDMLPIADGSDMGGSLRNPAGYNDVLGLRPSQGRVPHWPAEDLFFSQLGTEGPMARNAGDLALLYDVLAGPDPRAPLSLPAEGSEEVPTGHGPRIAWLGDLGGHLAMEPGVLDLCEAALARFEAVGGRVEPLVPAFGFEALWRAFVVLRAFSAGSMLRRHYDVPAERALLKPEAQWEVETYLALDAAALAEAVRVRSAWYALVCELFEHFDALALPSAQAFPFDVETDWPREIAGRAMDSYHRWMEVSAPATLSGCPAVSLPAGFGGANGRLPMGVQLIGPPRGDRALLRFAALYESMRPARLPAA